VGTGPHGSLAVNREGEICHEMHMWSTAARASTHGPTRRIGHRRAMDVDRPDRPGRPDRPWGGAGEGGRARGPATRPDGARGRVGQGLW